MLPDKIERLNKTTRNIKAAATDRTPAGPFTTAILTAGLGDLIREIDSSELGLFQLTSQGPDASELQRVEFHGATPLRKKRKDLDADVYAHAALRCINRFKHVRDMPRARSQVSSMLEAIEKAKENIQSLAEVVHSQPEPSVGAHSAKGQIEEEERQVQALQQRIAQLQKRKEAVLNKQHTDFHRSVEADSSFLPITPIASKRSKEDQFWSTPVASTRTLHFTDNLLLDEQVDLADISIDSHSGSIVPPDLETAQVGQDVVEASQEEEDEDETTVLLPQVPPSKTYPKPEDIPAIDPGTPKTRQARVKVNLEVERICAKIWTTVGDLIVPGHGFDTSGRGSNRPPHAKETITLLHSIACLTPLPQSPSYTSTITSQSATTPIPTAQQILTAYLLISLLSYPPHFSMPLGKLKVLIAEKAGSDGPAPSGSLVGVLGGPQGTSRVLYGCVAKRLIKIDRGGGEQVVKFDV